ncbi:Ribose methyltransferase, partial [Podochytrium sp. JEL0797]
MSKEVLVGSSPVLAALQAQRRQIFRLILNGDDASPARIEAQRLAVLHGVKVATRRVGGHIANTTNGLALEVAPLRLDALRCLSPLQGADYAAVVSDKESLPLRFTPKRDPRRLAFPVWLALDQLNDPMNMGAIIRTASFLAIDGILTTSNATVPLSPAVSKASAGALESYTNLYMTKNLPTFLQDSKANGWSILGTDISNNSKSRVVSCWDKDPIDSPVILVMGSEGEGLRKAVSKQCDLHLLIPNESADASKASE